jgi:hypothetical protein
MQKRLWRWLSLRWSDFLAHWVIAEIFKSYGIVYLGPWDHKDLDSVKNLLLVWPFKGTLAWDGFFTTPLYLLLILDNFWPFLAKSESAPRFFNNMRTLEGQYFNHMRLHIVALTETFRYLELCSTCLKESLGRGKPATILSTSTLTHCVGFLLYPSLTEPSSIE